MKNKLFENQKERKQFDLKNSYEDTMNIYFIDVVSFNTLFKQKEMEIFAIFMKNVNIQFRKIDKSSTDSKMIVFVEYHDFLNVFSKEKVDELSFHKKHDHRIELKEEKKTKHEYASLYNMSKNELFLIKKYLQEHLNKKFIEFNIAFYVFLILFVKKFESELRFCVDYQKLNAITKKNRYSISLIVEKIAKLSKTK